MPKELNIKGLSEEVLDLLAGFDIEPYSKVNIELESHMDYINDCEEDDENDFEEEIAITDDEDYEEDSFNIGNYSDIFIPLGGVKYDHINVSPIKGLEGLKEKITGKVSDIVMPLQGKLINKEDCIPTPIMSTASIVNRIGEEGYENALLNALKDKVFNRIEMGDIQDIVCPFDYDPMGSGLEINKLREQKDKFKPLPMLLPINRRFEEGVVITFPREKCEVLDKVEEKYDEALKDIQNEETIEKVNEKKEFVKELIMHKFTSIRHAKLAANDFIEELEKLAKEEQEINEEPNDRYLEEDIKSDIRYIFDNFKKICTNKTLLDRFEQLTDETIQGLSECENLDDYCLKFINDMNNLMIEFFINDILNTKKSIVKEFGDSMMLNSIVDQAIRALGKYSTEQDSIQKSLSKQTYINRLYVTIIQSLEKYTNNLIKKKYELSK